MPKRSKPAPEAHLHIEPIEPDRARDVAEYARKALPSGNSVTIKQFRFIEKYFELDFDGPKAVVMAGFQTGNPSRKAQVLLAIPAVAEEIIRRMTMKRTKFNLELDDIEAEMWNAARERDEDSTHSARVNALANLMRSRGAFEKTSDKKAKVPVAVNIDMGEILGPDEDDTLEYENNESERGYDD